MRITGLLPIKGMARAKETLELIPRLFATAGNLNGNTFDLIVLADEDEELAQLVESHRFGKTQLIRNETRLGYWKSLSKGAQQTDAGLLVTLANDLIPGVNWLQRGLSCYAKASNDFGKPALVGFCDGVHLGNHAGHILAPRSLLQTWYGNALFPVMYDHLHADVEMVMRAIEEKRWAYSIYAWLFHNHHVNGKPFDPVYQLGHARQHDDYRIFQERRANGWK